VKAFSLDPPHDAFLDVVEVMALAGFEELTGAKHGLGKGHTNGSRPGPPESFMLEPGTAFDALPAWLEQADPALPLRRVSEGFVLEPRETALLGLLFAAALSEHVARHIAATTNGAGQGIPLWLAQRLIGGLRPDDLAAAGTLRRFGFVGVEPDAVRVEARLWLREAVLDRFCGAPALEPIVTARIARATAAPGLANEDLTRQLRASLAERGSDRLSPLILAGELEPATVVASVSSLGLVPHVVNAVDIPEDPEVRDRLARLWSRDAALDAAALVILAGDRAGGTTDFADRVAGHVIVVGPPPAVAPRRTVRIVSEAAIPSVGDAADRWRRSLGPSRADKLGRGLARVASQFRLSGMEIDVVCASVGGDIDAAPDAERAAAILWHAAGRVSPAVPVPGVSVVEPTYQWADIVLAAPIEAALRRVEAHVRHATTVMDDWGFGQRMAGRGRGVAALFAGPSGTGKTMAAEVLASSLDLRMMVIDLSQIISKYVGETSKNIAAAFDQAERSGAVMVWNEGDAVWGARGTVGNATDRHVNAEIGDLLQRIETFRGFTIVTTNMRKAIDPAFLRRFRFAIDFPMPSEGERLRLWEQVFPSAAPVEAIDWQALAALPLSGGSIRNVALGSAFLAAEDGGPIDASRITAELADELQKQDKPMPAIRWESSR
jgi:hypothetical protein